MKMDAAKILKQRFKESHDDVFFTTKNDQQFSYGSFWNNAQNLANNWKKQGLKKGQIIAFIFPNDIALPCCYLACALGGFIACPILDSHHPDLINNIISRIKPDLIIRKPPELTNKKITSDNNKLVLDNNADSGFMILFTSGLTGEPKAMLHSLNTIVGSAQAFAKLSNMSAHTNIYQVLPMAYMAGILNTFFSPLLAGARIVEGPLFSPETATDFWTRPLELAVNTLNITPTIAAILCRLTRNNKTIEDIQKTLTQVQCTSAPIQSSQRQLFIEKFAIPLQDCYGMTELGGPVSLQNLNDASVCNNLTSSIENIQISLRGESDQKELWIASPHAMLGYLENGVLKPPFDENHFMDTGDIATYEDGKLQITGRKKDIIIRGGINISPMRIESVLSLMTEINEVIVIGCEHKFWGEEIVACITSPNTDPLKLSDAVKVYAAKHLATYERPDRILLIDEFPRSFIGKIKKDVLREMSANK